MKKSKKIKKMIFTILIIVLLALILIGIDFYQKVFTPYAGYTEESITLHIKKGSSATAIAKQLYRNKIIADYNYFRIYYRLFFKHLSLKTGEYKFDQALTMREVIKKLFEGHVLLHKVTIHEGLIITEIAEVLANHSVINIDPQNFIQEAASPRLILALDPKATDLEGYLYPDTYMVRKGITVAEMIELMVSRFKETFTHSMKWRANELNLSVREVITLASLVEKETSSRGERFLISSVFHNRLKKKMGMDCDPTIIYALKRDNLYNGKLGWNELKYDSPYNTRLYRGLPPGPICSPGFDSIEAALYPENTDYIFFVAKDSKSHYFSKTLREHNQAVQKYIINRKH